MHRHVLPHVVGAHGEFAELVIKYTVLRHRIVRSFLVDRLQGEEDAEDIRRVAFVARVRRFFNVRWEGKREHFCWDPSGHVVTRRLF